MSGFMRRPCRLCGELTPEQTWGQPRIYCSDECRSEYHNRNRRQPRRIRSVQERLTTKLVPNGECLEFQGHRNEHGYGVIRGDDGRTMLAHRAAWETLGDKIPDGMCVCHTCDNPPCCNLEHLLLGTHLDNMRDRDLKGRTLKGDALRLVRWGR